MSAPSIPVRREPIRPPGDSAVRGIPLKDEDRLIAQRVVRDVLRLGWDSRVRVATWEHMLPLAKEIVKEARRAGADTLLDLNSDDVWYDAVLNLPEAWLQEPSALAQAVYRTMTAEVYLGGPADPAPMAKVSAARWEANAKGAEATEAAWEEAPVPALYVALGTVTEARARTYGFDFPTWVDVVRKASGVDPARLRDRGAKVAARLRDAQEARLTAPDGTAFSFALHGAEPVVSSGEARPVEGQRSSYQIRLPAGSVAVALQQGSGEGTVAAPSPIPQAGRLIRGLRWVFRDGRLVEADAQEHAELFLDRWEKARAKGADQLGALSVGLNPEARFGFLENAIVEGAVTVLLGDNEDLGGTNGCGFQFPVSLPGATLEVDGQELVAEGALRV